MRAGQLRLSRSINANKEQLLSRFCNNMPFILHSTHCGLPIINSYHPKTHLREIIIMWHFLTSIWNQQGLYNELKHVKTANNISCSSRPRHGSYMQQIIIHSFSYWHSEFEQTQQSLVTSRCPFGGYNCKTWIGSNWIAAPPEQVRCSYEHDGERPDTYWAVPFI